MGELFTNRFEWSLVDSIAQPLGWLPFQCLSRDMGYMKLLMGDYQGAVHNKEVQIKMEGEASGLLAVDCLELLF